MASEVRDDNTLLWFPWTAFHEIHPARAKEREIRGIAPGDGAKFETGREAADQAASKLPARAPSLSGCANRNYRSLTTRPPYPLCRGAALQCFILKDRTTRFCTRMCHELSRSNHRWRLARPFPAHRRNLHMPPRILSNTWRTSHRHHGSDGPERRLGPTSGATSGRIVHQAPPDEYVRFTRDLAREY